jgi:hypothetical protein
MRRLLLGLVVALGISAFGAEAHAQLFGGINDPALAYYGLYLPRQQQQAMLGGPEATLNAVAANRQQFAATNRNAMFDPNGAGSDSDDYGDFTTSGPRKRKQLSTTAGRFGVHGGNLNGLGPQPYYNTASRYYRDLRAGRGRNANVFAGPRRGAGGALGAGVSYGGVGGVPGPR